MGDLSVTSGRNSLVPSFLYKKDVVESSPSTSLSRFMVASPSERGNSNITMYSPAFYGACAVGGFLCCGLTHMAVTPLDLVKCNMQVDLLPSLHFKYKLLFLSRLRVFDQLIFFYR